MRKYLFVAFGLLASALNAQQWQWFHKIEGLKCEAATDVNFTPDQDIIVTGIYQDPGGISFELSDKSFAPNLDPFKTSHSSLFLARYKPNGQVVWIVNAYAANGIHPWDSYTDKQGNTIVCGNFRGIAIFNSTDGKSKSVFGMPGQSDSNGGPLTYYVAKYNPNGALLWVKTVLGEQDAVAFEVQTDDAGNVYVKGYSHYTTGMLAFDKHIISTVHGTYNLTLIIVKYSVDGDEQWVLYGGNANFLDLHVYNNGNFMVRGRYHEQPMFQHTNGQYYKGERPVSDELYVTDFHFNSAGELVSATPDFPCLTKGYVVKYVNDRDSNQYALITPNTNWNTQKTHHYAINGKKYSTHGSDIIVAKFDKKQKLCWVTPFYGAGDEKILDITLDINGNPIVSGLYYKSICIKGITGDSVRLESELQTMFIAQLSANGIVLWACNAGSLLKGYGEHLHLNVNTKNQLYICGQLNVPSKIGRFNLDVKGERGWNSPGWPRKYDYGTYSDGFVGCMNLESPEYDVTVNLQRDVKKATKIIEEMIENTPELKDTAVDFSSGRTFTSKKDSTYFGVVVKTDLSAQLYPNPASRDQIINVLINLPESASVAWSIYDPNGKLVLQETRQYGTEINYQFSLAGYTSGMYLLFIETGFHKIVKKIIVY